MKKKAMHRAVRDWFSEHGRKAGSVRSEAKTAAARINGRLGALARWGKHRKRKGLK